MIAGSQPPREIKEMSALKLNLCGHCARAFRTALKPSLTLQLQSRTFFIKHTSSSPRSILKLPPPDPSAPHHSVKHPVKRDPGVTLGEHGIPVPPQPSYSRHRDHDTHDKSWAETVMRTLSGGMKSDYIKCSFSPFPNQARAKFQVPN